MNALIIQPALREDKLSAAPKKARKVLFSDPFIVHAVRSWLSPVDDPFGAHVVPLVADPEWAGKLAGACAVSHYHRFYPTYYIKGEGEVDVAYIHKKRFWPVEIKWTGQLKPKDLKQVRKYPNSLVCSRLPEPGVVQGLRYEPLPLTLLRLGPSPITMRS
jgi:predicted AAA+ superfamily ATPase